MENKTLVCNIIILTALAFINYVIIGHFNFNFKESLFFCGGTVIITTMILHKLDDLLTLKYHLAMLFQKMEVKAVKVIPEEQQ